MKNPSGEEEKIMDANEILSNEQFYKDLLELTAEKLAEAIKPPVFNGGRIPTCVASVVLEKNEQAIREFLKSGKAPYGYAQFNEATKRWNYYICPKQFYEYCGFAYNPAEWDGRNRIN